MIPCVSMQKTGNNAFCIHFILAVSLFLAQKTITYSKTVIETLEKGVSLFKVNNKDTRTASILSF